MLDKHPSARQAGPTLSRQYRAFCQRCRRIGPAVPDPLTRQLSPEGRFGIQPTASVESPPDQQHDCEIRQSLPGAALTDVAEAQELREKAELDDIEKA